MTKTCATLCLAAGLIVPSAASADGILDSDSLNNAAGAYTYDQGFSNYQSAQDYGYSGSGFDWGDFRAASLSNSPFDGGGSSTDKVAYNPSNPGIGGPLKSVKVNLSADAYINSAGKYYEGAYGQAYNYIYFTLSSSQAWTFDADVTGTTAPGGYSNYAQSSIDLYQSDYSIYYGGTSLYSNNGVGDYNQHMSTGGNLGPGSYVAIIQTYASMNNYYWGGYSTGSSSSTMSNGVFAIPAPGAGALLGIGGLAAARRRRV